jgi:hypothetical protein
MAITSRTGLIVNFTAGTVLGFGFPGFMDHPVRIAGINEVTVVFGGFDPRLGSNWSLNGTIDRVTGDVEAGESATDAKTGNTIYSTT